MTFASRAEFRAPDYSETLLIIGFFCMISVWQHMDS